MLTHAIETCSDDHNLLRERLDALTAQGARILAVLWQPRRADPTDQSAAFDSLGSFVIVSESGGAQAGLGQTRPADAQDLLA